MTIAAQGAQANLSAMSGAAASVVAATRPALQSGPPASFKPSGFLLAYNPDAPFANLQDLVAVPNADSPEAAITGMLETANGLRANLVVYRIADHLADARPNPIAAGMARELGWEGTEGGEFARFRLASRTLLQLSQFLQDRLGARTLRVIGDPAQPVINVGAIWGRATQMPAIRALRSDIDVLLVGYIFEWEAVLYVQDQNAIGMKKSMILLGQVPSLQGGMKYFAEWLGGQITEVPVEHIPLVETWWNLDHPVNEIKTTI